MRLTARLDFSFPHSMHLKLALLIAGALSGSTAAWAAPIQIDCTSVFNARPISTYSNGALVPWTVGIDGAGRADGFATVSAARANDDSFVHALPDNGDFPRTADHPDVRLSYNNADDKRAQARAMEGASSCEISIPAKSFQTLFLFFTSAEGPSEVSATLHYQDGKVQRETIQIPDYYRAPIRSEKSLFALASDLAKWNAKGKMAEADHHFIYGWKIRTDDSRPLQSVTLEKTQAGYLVFWGATGETVD